MKRIDRTLTRSRKRRTRRAEFECGTGAAIGLVEVGSPTDDNEPRKGVPKRPSLETIRPEGADET